jgi:hypothetical protein
MIYKIKPGNKTQPDSKIKAKAKQGESQFIEMQVFNNFSTQRKESSHIFSDEDIKT